jgi:hypothetical protein
MAAAVLLVLCLDFLKGEENMFYKKVQSNNLSTLCDAMREQHSSTNQI